MRLGVCVFIIRGDHGLFLRDQPQAELNALHVPCVFIDGEMITPLAAAQHLVKKVIGLYPNEISGCGIISLRHQQTADINVLVWRYCDQSSAPIQSSEKSAVWLPVDPELSAEIPDSDRQWLPYVLQRIRFHAYVTYATDGQAPVIRVRREISMKLPP